MASSKSDIASEPDSEIELEQEPDWSVARRGISLVLNDKTDEAELLFAEHSQSFHVKAGRSYVLFMNALMTFEKDKFQLASQHLKEIEEECASDVGWLKSVTTKLFGVDETSKDYIRNLERQVVLADSQVFLALLTFHQHELGGYVQGGWMLRKAWKAYQHTYNQILKIYRSTFGTSPSGFNALHSTRKNGSTLPSPSSTWSVPSTCNGYSSNATSPVSPSTPSTSGLRSSLSMLFSFAGNTTEQKTSFVEPSEVTRLMSAVSFGYGMFQLCVSLLPPSALKFIHILGFEGDRQAGITALMYSRLGEDIRAPLASLTLLWYHTIVRPYFAVDGANLRAGVEAAKELISECQPEFEKSALFLFFTGRVERLQANARGALVVYKQAMETPTRREVKLLLLHEIAWCHLIRRNYNEAVGPLTKIILQLRWANVFYTYLRAICYGAKGNGTMCRNLHQNMVTYATENGENELGLVVSRRLPKLVNLETDQTYSALYYRLLVYESLYTYNALPSCSNSTLQKIVVEIKSNYSEEPMVGLADLIEGVALSYLGDRKASMICYRNCLQRRNPANDTIDQHISAYALYELGSALCKENNIEEGKCLLKRALVQYKDFDFDGRLNILVNAALKTVS